MAKRAPIDASSTWVTSGAIYEQYVIAERRGGVADEHCCYCADEQEAVGRVERERLRTGSGTASLALGDRAGIRF